ncbi:SNF2 family N-terminal domain-containing protein [Xylaria sp. FL0064]|nr:SNF2 family N-terminal domain-containing protein [Xylaria sp. FL0064]
MDYDNPHPRKRAKLQDSAPQLSASAKGPYDNGVFSTLPAEFAQATTSHLHQRQPSSFIASHNDLTTAIPYSTYPIPADFASEWLTPTIQHQYIGRMAPSHNSIPPGRPVVNESSYFMSVQNSLETITPGLPLQPYQYDPRWNRYGQTSQQHLPLLEPRPSQVMSHGHQSALQFVSPHAASSCQLNIDLMAHWIPKADILHQPAVSKPEVETVCFGMIQQLSGTCNVKCSTLPAEVPVKFNSSDRFTSVDGDETITGRIHSNHSQMIYGLLEEDTLQLFASCITNKDSSTKPARDLKILPCSLELTVYGPIDLLDEIGDWFQEQEIYLQDPQLCHLDVKYCNPQKLSASEPGSCPLVSVVTTKKALSIEMQAISPQASFLDGLQSRDNLQEAQQPTAIRSTLKRHQKQALTFITQRERGWAFDQEYIDLWEACKTDHDVYFVNKVSNACQYEEPAEFRGGIIADTMGLGKTLTMIALVAADLDSPRERISHIAGCYQDIPEVETTLIIIPPPLLDTWEEQLSEHVFKDRIKWCRHHSKSRITGFDNINSQHIVLTTYQTTIAEWKGYTNAQPSPLFSVRWRRIILDEAHFIRNASSKMAQAACALHAGSRWAVSGTPVQNRLADLSSLLKFIRASPYNDVTQFETDISLLWKSGEDEEAVKRLQYLSACLLLRRAKGTINLPAKRDLLCPVDFLPEEKTAYETLRKRAVRSIDEAVSGHHGSSSPNVYANALERIESLRLFCDLGLQYHARHETQNDHEWSSIAQQAFNSKRGIEPLICIQCSLSLDFTESLLDEPNSSVTDPQFSSCMKFICGECILKLSKDHRAVGCGHKPTCPFASVSTGGVALEETHDTLSNTPFSSMRLPSKVEALITDIKSLPQNTKCVVFSTWRLTLDLVKAGLDQNSIQSIRFDGKVPQNERGAVVAKFRNDPDVRIMLLTVSCGAVGLTLTVASRAYLMEPHWNPTLEEQALARVHRLGQTKEVTTVRLYMRGSFEEEVIKVQESKKQLANVLLLPHGGSADDNLATLQGLRSLL